MLVPGHADDLVLRVQGTGSRRLVLVGHLDTVIAHDRHRPLSRDGDKLLGSGTVDMKGGVVLALGLLRALAAPERRASFAEAALLLVQDEEWRVGDLRPRRALRRLRRLPVLRGRAARPPTAATR